MAFGVGLGEVAGKVFRIGHLGMLTDAMVLSGLAVAEMCMADLGWPVRLGNGVAAAQEWYRGSARPWPWRRSEVQIFSKGFDKILSRNLAPGNKGQDNERHDRCRSPPSTT